MPSPRAEVFSPKADLRKSSSPGQHRTRGYVKGVRSRSPVRALQPGVAAANSRPPHEARLERRSSRTRGSPKWMRMCSACRSQMQALVDYLRTRRSSGCWRKGSSWRQLVGPDGRIHGRVITNGPSPALRTTPRTSRRIGTSQYRETLPRPVRRAARSGHGPGPCASSELDADLPRGL